MKSYEILTVTQPPALQEQKILQLFWQFSTQVSVIFYSTEVNRVLGLKEIGKK